MDSSGYKFNKFQVLLPDDGVRRPKHIAGKIIRIYTTCCLRELGTFLIISTVIFRKLKILK